MAKEDIHNTRELLNRKAEGYISQLFTEDQEDTRLFINDLLAQGFSAARVLKMLSTLSSIRKRLKKPFKNVTANESYLWCKIPTRYNPKFKNDYLSYGFICRLLNELAEKANVKKAVNTHSFRHSRATFMASHLKEPAMREFFGRGKDSEMPATYVHLSGRDMDEVYYPCMAWQKRRRHQSRL